MNRIEAQKKYLKRLLAIMFYSLVIGIASTPVLYAIMVLMEVKDPEYQRLMSYISGLFIYLNYTLPETFKAAAEFSPKGNVNENNSDSSNDDPQ